MKCIVISGLTCPSSLRAQANLTPARTISLAYVPELVRNDAGADADCSNNI